MYAHEMRRMLAELHGAALTGPTASGEAASTTGFAGRYFARCAATQLLLSVI
jgi:hypothetical protein